MDWYAKIVCIIFHTIVNGSRSIKRKSGKNENSPLNLLEKQAVRFAELSFINSVCHRRHDNRHHYADVRRRDDRRRYAEDADGLH